MAARTRTNEQRLRDRVRISEMYLACKTQREIARQIGVSQSQVSYELKKLHEHWRITQAQNIDLAKSLQLMRLDRQQARADEAWEKSRGTIVKNQAKTIRDAEGNETTVASMTKHESPGDPRFLEVILSCIDKRTKLLGLDEPTKLSLTTPEDEPIQIMLDQLSTQELETLVRIADQHSALARPGAGSGSTN